MTKQYTERDAMALDEAGGYYMRHVMAMTGENLHGKGDIAAELGWRDMQIDALQQKLDSVLVENAEIKSGIADITFMRDDDFFASTQEAQRVMGSLVNIKTPATDAILNEVRAEGVEKFADSSYCSRDQHQYVMHFAAQLRAGSAEGGV